MENKICYFINLKTSIWLYSLTSPDKRTSSIGDILVVYHYILKDTKQEANFCYGYCTY